MSRRAPPPGAPGQRGERRDKNDVQEWLFKRGRRERVVNWLGLDSWIDSTLAETWAAVPGPLERRHQLLCPLPPLRLEAPAQRGRLGRPDARRRRLRRACTRWPCRPSTRSTRARFLTGKFAVKFLDRNGNEIGQRGILHNDAVPLDEIPDHLIKATLATEDRRFFEHFGVDVLGTVARARRERCSANEVVQGGSTLTQQLAKNLFLSSERSLERKIKEVFLAFLLESRASPSARS